MAGEFDALALPAGQPVEIRARPGGARYDQQGDGVMPLGPEPIDDAGHPRKGLRPHVVDGDEGLHYADAWAWADSTATH
jgi:hypothetical protein